MTRDCMWFKNGGKCWKMTLESRFMFFLIVWDLKILFLLSVQPQIKKAKVCKVNQRSLQTCFTTRLCAKCRVNFHICAQVTVFKRNNQIYTLFLQLFAY